jgi:lipid-A-disaccharide synthase
MVNLIAERQIVPELIQHDMTVPNIVGAAEQLLTNPGKADRMRLELARVRALLTSEGNPLERAGEIISNSLQAKMGDQVSVDTFGRK